MASRRVFLACSRAAFALTLLARITPAAAAPLDLHLTFSSLPSAQGFTYTPSGSHALAIESSIFDVSGGVLTQNSMGQYLGGAGGGVYYQRVGDITATDSKQIRVRTRCLTNEGGTGGFVFGFGTPVGQFVLALTPTQAFVLRAGGWSAAPGTFDNTAFHDYILDWTSASSYRLYRDGTLIHTGSDGYPGSYNYVFFGDGTGGANAHGEITSYEFIQDLATPTRSSTWGRLKNLYR